MLTLINLIGEQPIPNLLPVRHLQPEKTVMFYTDTTERTVKRIQKLVENSSVHKIDPYDFNKIIEGLEKVIGKIQGEPVFNITGGTKMMSVAAHNIAKNQNAKVIYLQSEDNVNLLHTLTYNNHTLSSVDQATIGELINIDYYLKAHLPAYETEGYHTENNKLSSGGFFEKAIADVLEKNNFEVLAGVRPKGVGNQIEIDLVFRLKGTNVVAIAEIKLGDAKGEGPKKGLDQLVMASEREYLGTYTKRFLITARKLNPDIKELALAHRIQCVELMDYNNDRKLSEKSSAFLANTIKSKMI